MIQTLKMSQITVLENPRKCFEDVDELAKSIADCGLLQPIAVRQEGSKYILVDGEQRLRAFKQLKRVEIPVFILGNLETQEAKEAQMTANLMRSDLSFVERARGFSALLINAPVKYNEKVIANKFGLKEKDVKQMVRTIRKIVPEADADLGTGRFDMDDLETVAAVIKEYQLAVVKEAAKNGGNIHWAIRNLTAELYFDDVFKKEQARAAGKIHYEGYNACYTFDKDYAAKVKAEFEARTKKNYVAEKEKAKTLTAAQIKKQTEQKKETREKQKAKLDALLTEMRELLPKFISKPVNAEILKTIAERTIAGHGTYGLGADDCKLLLRAWQIEFKASELSTSDLRGMVISEILNQYLKNETNVCNLYEWISINHGFTTIEDQNGFRTWINGMKKALQKKAKS
ncbi:MAG: ParB/RepB/Spo0J family partition protein [Verrucomicrobiae bacterium]|nr:ParB/RepB/Spo0J family partition protein [Verrucomicrobiae bacterium]